MEECRWQIGSDLLIYGLDFPYNREEQFHRDIEVINSLEWSEEDKAKIKGENLKRLLGIETGEASVAGGDLKITNISI